MSLLNHAIPAITALVINQLIQALHTVILLAIAAIQAALTAHLLVQVGINFSQAKKNRYYWGVIADIKR